MARLNPWTLTRPEPRSETRVFTDAAQPGAEIALTLRALDGCDMVAASEQGEEYIAVHLEGKGKRPPVPLLTPDGEVARLSPAFLRSVAMLEAMQVPEDAEEPYGLLDFVGFAVRMPDAFQQIVGWMGDFMAPAEPDPGNSPTAATGSPSEPPSATGKRTRR